LPALSAQTPDSTDGDSQQGRAKTPGSAGSTRTAVGSDPAGAASAADCATESSQCSLTGSSGATCGANTAEGTATSRRTRAVGDIDCGVTLLTGGRSGEASPGSGGSSPVGDRVGSSTTGAARAAGTARAAIAANQTGETSGAAIPASASRLVRTTCRASTTVTAGTPVTRQRECSRTASATTLAARSSGGRRTAARSPVSTVADE